VTRTEVITHLDDPTPKGRRRIQEAINECEICADLAKVLKENH